MPKRPDSCDATGRPPSTTGGLSFSVGPMVPALAIAMMPLFGCGADSATGPYVEPTRFETPSAGTPSAETHSADTVRTLDVVTVTDSTVTVRWTQVDGGGGAPASYEVRYAPSPINWSLADVGCAPPLDGGQIGAPMSCAIDGLEPGTTYDIQLSAFSVVQGEARSASLSNVATVVVERSPVADPDSTGVDPNQVSGRGIWVDPSRLAQLPVHGAAWNRLLVAANEPCGAVDLSDQEQTTNVCVMAKGLVYARTGEPAYRADVVTAIAEIVTAPPYNGRALALGRELGAYVIAADLIGLVGYDPVLDGHFREVLKTLRTTYTSGASPSLVECHERRPNNWGAMCGSTRVAIAAYLGDTDDLERAARVLQGYLGDRSAYSGFRFGADLSWQCDPARPVGINPVRCARRGLSLDGVLPDDQRRGGPFVTSPPDENYVWEAMQGLLAQAVMLEGAGYTPFEWGDRALLRAARWQYEVNDFPATGDDAWIAPVLNHYYGTSFPVVSPRGAGKNIGWTNWTHP
jgi:hypothetical protein